MKREFPRQFQWGDLAINYGVEGPWIRYWGDVKVRDNGPSGFWVEWLDQWVCDDSLCRAGLKLVQKVRDKFPGPMLPDDIAALHAALQKDSDVHKYGFLWETNGDDGVWRFRVPTTGHGGTMRAVRRSEEDDRTISWEVFYADENIEEGRDLCMAIRRDVGEAIHEALRLAEDYANSCDYSAANAVSETQHWVGEFRRIFDLTYGNPRIHPMTDEAARSLLASWGFEDQGSWCFRRPWTIEESTISGAHGWRLGHEQDNTGEAYAYRARSLSDLLRMPVAPGVPLSVYDTIRVRP